MVEADVDVSKDQARPRPASHLPLPLHSWLPQWSEAIEGTSPWSSSCCSDRGTPLDQATVAFEALPLDQATTTGFQDWRWSWSSLPCGPPKHPCSRPTLGPLDDGRRVPWWWEDVVIVWLTRDSDVVMMQILVSMMTWCQDEVHRSCVGIMWTGHVSGHVSRSCDW